ncbi:MULTISPECIES: hypothetical protein [unclassified Veillonella]|jgi:hypothetical protein|uniref:hypothetical protein n=1 Tax=unclassified Veillonella TaxID=2630086 RepID=UPI000F8E0D35|nr:MULTISPECIES: hypothetical protein [unclassified Veillonella]
MRKRTAIALVLASVFAVNAGTATVEASWLSKTLKKLDNALGVPDSNTQVTKQSDGYLHLPQAGERWILISENKYYKTYLDRTKVYARGEAQDRVVRGVFKREFTPLGSQWLGGFGEIKPDVVTVEYYSNEYYVNSVSFHNYGTYSIPTSYYDVHGNLIYRNGSIERKYYGNYIPDSEEEHIKDRLFHMFGWDY